MENSVIGDAVENARHTMLADPKADVAAGTIAGVKVTAVLDVVERGAVQVRTPANHQWQCLGHILQNITTRFARRDVRTFGRVVWDAREQIRVIFRHSGFQFRGKVFVGRAPGIETRMPLGTGAFKPGSMAGKEFPHFGSNEKFLLWQAEAFARLIREFRPTFAMRFARARHLGNAFADQRLGHNELR